ncbi:hypothetical protein CDEST_04404 [Colletotrichum destructivum]|uniref:Uncharacterized protein n=1 Tax=Colletotrichum destructivum TaxID=34406 RepID=A0AAX4I7N1_9PEZI|nr:hypothetical protein CDEST_04404 [Colletotrichum destructivum]
MASTLPPAQLEHVLQQLVNNLADLHKVLSDQRKPCHTENEQVTAQNSPEPGGDAEGLKTPPPLETATTICAASTAEPNRTDEDAPVVHLTGAISDVAEDAVVSEPLQSDAFVPLPRNLNEWIVSPLPNGIRLKVFQASGTKWLQDHPLFGLMTLKLDLNKAGASRSILEGYTEDPIHMGFWTQYFESVYANYTCFVRTRFQLVDIPALEGGKMRAHSTCASVLGFAASVRPTSKPSTTGVASFFSQMWGHQVPEACATPSNNCRRNRMVKSRVLGRSTLSIPVLAALSSWLSPASSEQIIQIISSYILPRHIAMHQRSLYSIFPRPSTPADSAPESTRFVFNISYWVPMIHFPDIEDPQSHEEGLLICRELGSVFGPQHLADASDTDSTQQQFGQVGPTALAAGTIGGLGYTVTDLLFLLLRRINFVLLAKYSPLQRTQNTVKEKWKDLMSEGRRSTVLERRSTVVTTLNEISPHSKYTIVILSDDKVEQKSSSEALNQLLIRCDEIEEPARPSGISHHLLLVSTTMSTWEQRWHEILDVIEVETSIQMHEIQNTQRLDELMFDRSFRLSKKYFSLLQFLKLASKSVEEPTFNFEASHRHFLEIVTSAAQHVHDEEWNGVKDRWNHVATSVGVATRRIQDRIEHLIEEVKTHQESMFNATSLRETNNGMALNRSVYVLTAVTILYAPVGFMAQDTKFIKTFWALPFLNSPAEEGHTKVLHGFWTSFITIPILTYFVSVYASLFFGSSRFRKTESQNFKMRWAYYSELRGYVRDILSHCTGSIRFSVRGIYRQRPAAMFGPAPARTYDITGTREDGIETQLGSEGV